MSKSPDSAKSLPAKTHPAKNQGEGDYAATRRYRQRTEEFLENHDVDEVAAQAAPESPAEAAELAAAEAAGKRRAKAEDPAVQERDPPRRGS